MRDERRQVEVADDADTDHRRLVLDHRPAQPDDLLAKAFAHDVQAGRDVGAKRPNLRLDLVAAQAEVALARHLAAHVC